MVVGEHDGGREVADRWLKDLAGVDKGGSQRANGDDLAVDELVASVEIEYHEVFFLFTPNIGELVDGVLRTGDYWERVIKAFGHTAGELESGEDTS